MVSVKNSNNDIETYANMRKIGPLEVFWQYRDERMHQLYPTCTSLTVHLENEQVNYFDEGEDMVAMLNDNQKVTQLQAFYNMNRDNPTTKCGSEVCGLP